ncbi:MAG TPA: M48 family metalloprotease [Methylocystis sp.]|nr:M48 family metalloprotease [Methylocystis sp.]
MWKAAARACTGIVALSLSACAQFDQQSALFTPPAPPPTVAPAPSAKPPAEANRSLVQHKELVAQFGGEYRAPTAETYLNGVLAKLAKTSEEPNQPTYRVTILNTPVVNAFALPSGNLYVTRGLLALADDGSEVAAVMAHEIGHVTARHSALRAEREREAAVISRAAEVIQNRQKGEEIRSSQRLQVAKFSRQQELEADAIGVRAIARAGYDPYGASRFLTALGKSTELRAALYGRKKNAIDFDILSTHPSTPERVAHAVEVARQIGAPGIGQRDRDAYLAAIEGVAFGDDPADGFVRGTQFTHPRLRFTFTAPEGFLLENSSEAVFGVRDRDNQAVRLDNVRAQPGVSLEDYVSSGWVDGLLRSSVRRLTIHGLPAVVASARAGEWNFRLAVIDMDGQLYRLIFAVRALSPEVERDFDESIATFRRLTPEEAHEVRELRISIATAAPGDTIASMAARMTTPNRPTEYFLLLNGLDLDSPLTPQERYKIVTE